MDLAINRLSCFLLVKSTLWTDNWQWSQKRMRSFPTIEFQGTLQGEAILIGVEIPLVDKAASFQVSFDRRSLGRETPSQQFQELLTTFLFGLFPKLVPKSGEVFTLFGREMSARYEWLLRDCKKL